MARYIRHCEIYSREFARVTLVDIALMSVRPSIIAATSVIFGLFCGYRALEKCKKLNKHPFPYSETEIKLVTFAWHEICSQLLKETTVTELEEFMKEISERLSFINYKCGKKLDSVFTELIVEFLPEFDKSWVDKLNAIIWMKPSPLLTINIKLLYL